MKEKEAEKMNATRNKKEDQIDVIYRLARNVGRMPGWYPGIPENLLNLLKTLEAAAWKEFDQQRQSHN